jgi:hypothetical protein
MTLKMNSARYCHIQSAAQSERRNMLEKALLNHPKAIAQKARETTKPMQRFFIASCTRKAQGRACLEDFSTSRESSNCIEPAYPITLLAPQAISGYAAIPAT